MNSKDKLINETLRQLDLARRNGIDLHFERQRQASLPWDALRDISREVANREKALVGLKLNPFHDVLEKQFLKIQESAFLNFRNETTKFMRSHLAGIDFSAFQVDRDLKVKLAEIRNLEIDRIVDDMAHRPAINKIMDAAALAFHIPINRNLNLENFSLASFRSILDASKFVSQNFWRINDKTFLSRIHEDFPFKPGEPTEDITSAEIDDLVLHFLQKLNESLGQIPPGIINAVTLFSLVFGIFVALYQNYDSGITDATRKAEYEVVRRDIRETRDQIFEKLEHLCIIHHPTTQVRLYTVERSASIRLSPKMKASVIVILPSDQPVELLIRKGKWIKVEYFDFNLGESRQGWVLKKYLRIVRQ
jgi:hypothetical protein